MSWLVPALASGLLALIAAPLPCSAQGQGGEVQLAAGLQHGTILHGSDGQVRLVVDLAAAPSPQATTRAPMSVALVIDRSGSMAGDKMANAIMAASSFIGNLRDGDVVAVYAYDDVVEQLAPPTVVSPATRPGLVGAVARLTPRGSTNLHGGLVAGISALSHPGAERPIRRVILISDGLANVGPSSPEQLGQVSAAAAVSGVSVTSIGVGLDYDESVLAAVAVRSGGRFYHLQEPAQMASILEAELNALTRTVARGVLLELAPGPGVQVLDATGADLTRRGSQVELRLGDMVGGVSRAVVVSLRVPTTGGPVRRAAQISLRYDAAEAGVRREATSAVTYRLSASQAAVDQSVVPRYAVLVERHEAALANQRAAELLGQGQNENAGDVLRDQAQRLRRRARDVGGAEGQELRREAERLEGAERRARRARSRPARRAAQLDMADDALGGLGF